MPKLRLQSALIVCSIWLAATLPVSAADDHSGGVHHRHHAAGFVGNSWVKGKPALTLGGEYEYRFHRYVGFGASSDYITKKDIFVLTFPVFFHPWKGLKLGIGPGFEYERGHVVHGKEKTEFVVRILGGYDFHVSDRFSITPLVEWDILRKKEVVAIGVAFGFGF